jgi:hypothetical protein
MREIRPSGSMSGEWKRSNSHRATPRLYLLYIILSCLLISPIPDYSAISQSRTLRASGVLVVRPIMDGDHDPIKPAAGGFNPAMTGRDAGEGSTISSSGRVTRTESRVNSTGINSFDTPAS